MAELCHLSVYPDTIKLLKRKLRITYEQHHKNRYDHHLRAAQCGQVQPHQRPGGGEDRHRLRQAPDHPQPDLRRGEPGGYPVCAAGHPGSAQAPVPAGGLHGQGGAGEPAAGGGRPAAGGAHRPCGGAGEDPAPAHHRGGPALCAVHQQDRHRGEKGRPAGGYCRLQCRVSRV